MVVILIIALILWLGGFGGLLSRRENTRIEEVAVNIIGLIDQEKVDTLLGKTEWGEIVRKRKIEISFGTANTIEYKNFADLASQTEGSFNSGTPLSTKTWTLPVLTTKLFKCADWSPSATEVILSPTSLTLILQWDTLKIDAPTVTEPHVILQLSHDTSNYREVHIDRRTGVTYERESTNSTPTCT